MPRRAVCTCPARGPSRRPRHPSRRHLWARAALSIAPPPGPEPGPGNGNLETSRTRFSQSAVSGNGKPQRREDLSSRRRCCCWSTRRGRLERPRPHACGRPRRPSLGGGFCCTTSCDRGGGAVPYLPHGRSSTEIAAAAAYFAYFRYPFDEFPFDELPDACAYAREARAPSTRSVGRLPSPPPRALCQWCRRAPGVGDRGSIRRRRWPGVC